MSQSRQSRHHEDCPFINRDDARCGNRFRLGGLDQAFGVCFGSYAACPMYHRISHEINAETSHQEAVASANRAAGCGVAATLTIGESAVPLRATGS